MSTQRPMSRAQLDAKALEEFIYRRVSDVMINHLAKAAQDVIRCDETMMPPPPQSSTTHNSRRAPITPPKTPPPVAAGEKFLPPLRQFIRNLVDSSNVQVPTLMSTLVYLNRLKSRLQPEAKGLRCTGHRIFLAALILTAKYLNDSSPKNKHWAKYTQIWNENESDQRCITPGCTKGRGCQREGHFREPDFEFSKTEVNLMEKQLLMLLEWELRITEDDLYRELHGFLEPIRQQLLREEAETAAAARREQERQMQELFASTRDAYANNNLSAGALQGSPNGRHGRHASRPSSSSRSNHSRDGSVSRSIHSSHSYAPSLASSHGSDSTGASTPPFEGHDPYARSRSHSPYYGDNGLYEPTVEIIVSDHHGQQAKQHQQYYQPPMPQVPQMVKQKSLLPYEIHRDEMDTGVNGVKPRNRVRGMFGRMFSGQQGTARA